MKVNSKSITALLIAFGLSLSLVGCNSTVEDNAELKALQEQVTKLEQQLEEKEIDKELEDLSEEKKEINESKIKEKTKKEVKYNICIDCKKKFEPVFEDDATCKECTLVPVECQYGCGKPVYLKEIYWFEGCSSWHEECKTAYQAIETKESNMIDVYCKNCGEHRVIDKDFASNYFGGAEYFMCEPCEQYALENGTN